MFECVIFDLDGLMIDSERVTREVFNAECEKLGIELDEEFFLGIIGTTRKTSQAQFNRFEGLMENLDKIAKKRMDTILYKAKNNENFYKKGLMQLLDYLFENNYKVCIATSSTLEYVTKILNYMENKYSFDAICTGDMVKNHKPEPDIFLLASNKVNIDPSKCLVLEDSRNGILAAKNAKMSVGFIYDTVKADDYLKSLYDYNFDSLIDVISLLEKK